MTGMNKKVDSLIYGLNNNISDAYELQDQELFIDLGNIDGSQR